MYNDFTGQKVGRWLCVEKVKIGSHQGYRCICECGTERNVYTHLLEGKHRKSRSCGCLQKEIVTEKNTKHGHNRGGGRTSRTYNAWHAMIQRCTNPNNPSFKNYGGRGIQVCAEWLKFENFIEDMGECPEKLEIDRIDVNGDYTKLNCRWTDETVQSMNKRIYANNTSGYKGVTKTRSGGYDARINYKNKTHYLGIFKTLEEAVEARKHAEHKLHDLVR